LAGKLFWCSGDLNRQRIVQIIDIIWLWGCTVMETGKWT
jgi:hypothetical protein